MFNAVAPPNGTAVPERGAVGFRWRQPSFYPANVDITAWRRLAPTADAIALVQQQDTLHGARVEMKLKSASARSVFEDKLVGLRLDSGARIGLKKSNGSPTMYYRNQFRRR